MHVSGDVRSAVVIVGIVIAVVVGGAARNDAAPAAATEPAGSTSKLAERMFSTASVGTETPPPVPAVDDLGTRGLTGHDGATVALTFDDGPHPDYTPQVLQILREYDVTATFCLVGTQVETYPELVKDIVEAGHTLCDHTVTHDMKLSHRSEAAIGQEIGDTLAAIHEAVPDTVVPFFRAPGGNFAPNVNAVARSYDQEPLSWSIDPRDWEKPSAKEIHQRAVAAMHPGAVLLFHDGGGDRSATVAALPWIIETLRAAGYDFVVPAR